MSVIPNPKPRKTKKAAETGKTRITQLPIFNRRFPPGELAACADRVFAIGGFFRFGFWISLASCVSGFGFQLLAQTTPKTSDDLLPLVPPRPEIPPTFWERHQMAILIVVTLLLGAVCAGVWFLLRPIPAVALTPAARARAALDPLKDQPETGILLSHVSRIVRSYFGAAFLLPNGEVTTSELIRLLQNHQQIGPELTAAVSEFLRQCDLRKFAPSGPLPPMNAVAVAGQLIEQAESKRAALLAPVPPA
jgi:hypothetical protein